MEKKVFYGMSVLGIVSIFALIGCGGGSSSSGISYNKQVLDIDFKATDSINNRAAYVTSQCYTKTTDDNNNIHNPCFTCHINSETPNYINDFELQEVLDFGDYTKVNRFTNLFKDRTQAVNNISDEKILNYIRENNYKDSNNNLILANKLNNIPSNWDVNENGKWDGYTPDCYFNFDNEGFDKKPNGEYTGWRAFAYYPFLGTFWPTNGSTDDVLIRLAKEFQQDSNGVFNKEIYKINLAIVESLIKRKDIDLENSVDENLYQVDLDNNGTLSTASKIVYNWNKYSYNETTGKYYNFSMSYVGLAKTLLESNTYLIGPGRYPKDTEFLHTVRYIDIDKTNDTIKMASRMKELRYGKKYTWLGDWEMENATSAEVKDKNDFPDRIRTIQGNTEEGLLTGLGWVYQGFIEDENGELRPQNYEETQYCIGCHSGIGATTDSTFVFQRKFDNAHFQKGWYHWSQDTNGLKGILEPKTPDDRYEYTLYLEQNQAGDEFRNNSEIMEKFFDNEGNLLNDQVQIMRENIAYLLYPSTKRALELNKAYKVIVDEQSFIYGRDAHVKPVQNVEKEIKDIGSSTGIIAVKYE
ncbi:hypothetical protein [Halarcobacter sp.]|uniref:hypothetical protein n=1 Tax=Halarcobacter sp. TaxID=2321133 RepID=UPI0029F4C65C|nr:hypothetical protein [Halarcobacter sp.]